MSDVGHINFFKIDHCGLHKVGSDKTHGYEVDETFSLIMGWLKGRKLPATLPWDPLNAKRNMPKCYCSDVYKNEDTGDYFFVLWKSDSDGAGTIWGAEEENKTGNGTYVKYTNDYDGKKVIWGRPCYYWVIPEYNSIASIKFDHSVTDAQLFEDYVISCINNRVDNPKRKKQHTEKGFVRISHTEDDKTLFMYRFKMSLMSLKTSSSKLQELANKVTHIVRRETVLVNTNDERAEWVKKFDDYIPYLSPKPRSRSRRIEVKAEAKPSVKEIKEIIEKSAIEGRKPHDWDNVGFTTDTGIRWVDRYRLRDSIVVPERKDVLLNAIQLADAIDKERGNLLKPLKKDTVKKQMRA